MQRRVGNALGRRSASIAKTVRIIRILDRFVPSDAPTAIIPVVSLRGNQGYKVQGETYGRPWSVELYGGNFYLVKIHGLEAAPFSIPLHVLNYLRAHLLKGHRRVRLDHPPSQAL
jgi:hypothetical protein